MRLTVSIENKMIEELISISGASSKTKAVNQAITEWVRWKKRQKLKNLRGKIHFESNIETLDQLDIDELKDINE